MKVYFNTKGFDCLPEKHQLDTTDDPTNAAVAVLGAKTIDFAACRKLQAIYRFGVGRENIPEDVIARNDPPVYFPSERTQAVLYESTADFAVALIFRMCFAVALGSVDRWEKQTRRSLASHTLLVVGRGKIGGLVARKMAPFMTVRTYDTVENGPDELEPLLRTSDIVSLHIPLSEKTRGFFDAKKLSLLKDDAILVNTARGAIVDEGALYERIVSSSLRAAFDVFWKEPYEGKLKSLGKSRFFMTPHTSSQTIEYVREGFNDIRRILDTLGGTK
ncbi:MAG: NAD(P)-dependent oxidoreductase [Pseudomonadota bacterium]